MPVPGWDYRNVYWWGAGYSWSMPAGYGNDHDYGGELFLQPDVGYPPGYCLANGEVGGAEPPSSRRTTGQEQIKFQPPTQGNGPFKFVTHCQIWVKNKEREKGQFAFAIGTVDSSPGEMPMWPYIGTGHYLEMVHVPEQTVEPGGIVQATMVRMDLMDERFMGSQPIPTWPNWEMRPNPDSKLYPGTTPTIQNRGDVDLEILGFWGIAYPVG